MRRGAPNPTWRSVYRPPRRVRCATSELGAPRRLFRCATSDRGEPSERVGAPCRPAARRQKGAPGCSTLPLLGCGSGSGRWRHTRREPSSSADRAMRATTAPGVTRPSTGDATVHRCEAAVTGASDRGHGLAAWHVLVRRSSGMAWLSVWPQGSSFWPAARRGGSGLSFWPSRFSVWPQGLSSWSAASRGDAYPANGCVLLVTGSCFVALSVTRGVPSVRRGVLSVVRGVPSVRRGVLSVRTNTRTPGPGSAGRRRPRARQFGVREGQRGRLPRDPLR